MQRSAVVVVLALAACSKAEPSTRAVPGPGTGSARDMVPAPIPVPPGGVVVYLDDKPVATVDAAKIATWPRVDAIVPATAQQLGTWTAVSVRGKSPQDIPSPADRYPTAVPALFPGPDGPSFGMFDLVELASKGKPKVAYAGVTEIRITRDPDSDRGQNEEGGITDFDPAQIDIKLEGGSKPVLTGAEILALPREPPPNGDTNTQGWKLTTLLAAAGIKSPKKLVLGDATGVTVTMTAKELDPAVSVPYLKLNKKGQLRFRVYTKQGEGWALGGSLKGLSSIKVGT